MQKTQISLFSEKGMPIPKFLNEADLFCINCIKLKSVPYHTTRANKMASGVKYVPNDQVHSNNFKLLT